MSTPTTRNKRKTISPIIHLFLPVAFLFGLGSGYLLWGYGASPAEANVGQIQRVSVSVDDDPSLGPEDAPVTIIEFADYTCHFCAVWQQTVFNQLMANYPTEVHFVYRDLPILSPESTLAAEAANCAGEQVDYWQYQAALFSGKYRLGREAYEQYAADLGLDAASFSACLDERRYQAEVQADARDAAKVGLSGTPAFIINGRILNGALPFADFKTVIDEELAAQP